MKKPSLLWDYDDNHYVCLVCYPENNEGIAPSKVFQETPGYDTRRKMHLHLTEKHADELLEYLLFTGKSELVALNWTEDGPDGDDH